MHKRKYFTCSILNWIRRKKSSNKILEAAGLTQAELLPISSSHILRSNDMRDELIFEVVQRMLPYLDNKQLVNLQNNLNLVLQHWKELEGIGRNSSWEVRDHPDSL